MNMNIMAVDQFMKLMYRYLKRQYGTAVQNKLWRTPRSGVTTGTLLPTKNTQTNNLNHISKKKRIMPIVTQGIAKRKGGVGRAP